MSRIRIAVLLLLLPAFGFAADLSGVWHGDDGGTYYLTQRGNSLYWYAERSPSQTAWSNIYDGRISGDTIRGNWLSVPKGSARGQGKLELQIQHSGNDDLSELPPVHSQDATRRTLGLCAAPRLRATGSGTCRAPAGRIATTGKATHCSNPAQTDGTHGHGGLRQL